MVVISHDYWQRRFAGAPSAVGKQMRINNQSFTIVGVSAPGFYGLDPGHNTPVFIPLRAAPLLNPKPEAEEARRFGRRSFYWLEMMGRLRPGVTLQQAQTELAGKFRQYVESTTTTPKERENMPILWLDEGASGIDSLRRQYSKPLFILMTMVGLILAIACANIANLLLARATARRREIAVRLSLGAGRLRVVRQLLTESVLLSMAGGVLGLAVAMASIRGLIALLAADRGEKMLNASLNWQVLGFTLALTVITGIVFGLAPALQATKLNLTPALKETRAGASQRRGRFPRLGHVLIVAQVGASLLLVIAAGLFAHTIANLRSIELGFNRENLLVFRVSPAQAGYKEAALANFYEGLLKRFRSIPGVTAAAASQNALVSGYWNDEAIDIPGAPPQEKKRTSCLMVVDQSFLATMQIPVLLGRPFGERDMRSPRVAIVTEEFVKQFFPGENPIDAGSASATAKSPRISKSWVWRRTPAITA